MCDARLLLAVVIYRDGPSQAKLDLASAVEEASVAGGRAAEALAKLDATAVELSDVKIRLEIETATNVGLKAAVMETNEVSLEGRRVGCAMMSMAGDTAVRRSLAMPLIGLVFSRVVLL